MSQSSSLRSSSMIAWKSCLLIGSLESKLMGSLLSTSFCHLLLPCLEKDRSLSQVGSSGLT